MPLSIAPTLEDAIAILKTVTSAQELTRRLPDIEAGLEDLATRLHALEAGRAADMHAVQEMTIATNNQTAILNSLGASRDDHAKRLDTIEKSPPETVKRLDAIEAELKRLRAQIAPLPASAKPVEAPKTSIFGGTPAPVPA